MMPITEKQTYPPATVEDVEEQKEDPTCYPIPDWYPSKTIFITAEEQAAFEDYARKLMADPMLRIHKSMKRMAAGVNHMETDADTDINIEHIDFDLVFESHVNELEINLTLTGLD
jgi:hypothetical protein